MSKNKTASVFASVVFLKVQEFARRPVTEQARLRAQLDAVVAVTTAELAPASRIVLEASDGIAVAASVADFTSPSRILISRSFRSALADAAPGSEAALVPAGTFTDSGLRTHELFRPDPHAARRRARRYAALSTGAVAVLLAAGVAGRVSKLGQESFVEGMLAAYRDTAAQGEKYVRSLVQKVKF